MEEFLEAKKNGEDEKPLGGVLMVLGTTKDEYFENFKQEVKQESVLFINKINMEELENILKTTQKECVVVEHEEDKTETYDEKIEKSFMYRRLAKMYAKNILIHVRFDESYDERLLELRDFRILFALEQDASAVAGITSKGLSICKQRFGNKNETDIKKVFYMN